MAAKRVDHKDKKYNHLTMLYPVRSGGGGVGMFWMAQCDCGNLKEVRASEAKLGYVKTCGKCEYHSTLLTKAAVKSAATRDPKSAEREFLSRYVHGALKRNYVWALTPEQFSEIIKQNCTYCDAPPREYKRKARKFKGRGMRIMANGIDRIDSTLGYIPNNVVPCCTVCNRMKLAMKPGEFLAHVFKVAQHIKSTGLIAPDENA